MSDNETDKDETTNDGNNTITVGLNSYEEVFSQDGKYYNFLDNTVTHAEDMSKWIFSRTITAFHETFIHADLSAKDYMDNKKFDNSNIPYNQKVFETQWQHTHVLYDNEKKQAAKRWL